jgi:DNA replication and repair protein RecF
MFSATRPSCATRRSSRPEGRDTHHWLRRLEARDFRNLAHTDLAIPAGGIAVVGDNGQGKTNFLEAVAYLHLLRSVRGARDTEVVRFGEGGFHIRGEAVLGGTNPSSAASVVALGFERESRRKRVTVDGAIPRRLSDALGAIPSVTFAPVDAELVRGGPVARRRYLDVTLATTSRRYLAALQTYRGGLLQRNTALRALARSGARVGARDSGEAEAAVAAWEPMLAESGAVLWAERAAWAARWGPELARISAAIGERGAVHMRHAMRLTGAPESLREAGSGRGGGDLAVMLAAALDAGRAGDVRHGATRVGPHRDDLVLTLGGRDMRTYGSAGQQRTAAIALRILEASTLRLETGAAPVLLFDDPFAELDEGRARAILDVLGGEDVGQVILAVPRAADIPVGLTRLARYSIADGVVRGQDEKGRRARD